MYNTGSGKYVTKWASESNMPLSFNFNYFQKSEPYSLHKKLHLIWLKTISFEQS